MKVIIPFMPRPGMPLTNYTSILSAGCRQVQNQVDVNSSKKLIAMNIISAKTLLSFLFVCLSVLNLRASCSYTDTDGTTQFMPEGGLVAGADGSLYTCSGGNFTRNGAAARLHQARRLFAGSGSMVNVPLIGAHGVQTGWLLFPVYQASGSGPMIASPSIPNYRIHLRQASFSPNNPYNLIKISKKEDFSEPLNPGYLGGGEITFPIEGSEYKVETDYRGLIYYEVKETDEFGSDLGEWSPTMVTTPNLPASYGVETPFAWEDVPGATSYNLTLYRPNPANCENYQYQCYKLWEFLPHFEQYRVENTITGIEGASFSISGLMPDQEYYYNVQAIDENGEVIPAAGRSDANFYSYDSDAYVMVDQKPNSSFSFFYTSIPTGGPNSGQRVYRRDTGGGSPQETEITWKEIPGAAQYEIQLALVIPIPESVPFVDGYQYSGVLGNFPNFITQTKVLREEPNVVVEGLALNATDDLDNAKEGFQFRFPQAYNGYFSLGEGFVKLRFYYRVRALDENGNAITEPTIETKKITTDKVTFDYQTRTIFWDENPNADLDIIDISNNPNHFNKLPLLSKVRLEDQGEEADDTGHFRTSDTETVFVRRYVSRNPEPSQNIAARIFADKIRRSKIGIDYDLLKNGVTDELCQEYGYEDRFDYILQTYDQQELTIDLMEELGSNEVTVEDNKIILDAGTEDDLVDISTGECSIQVVKNTHSTELIFTQNGPGRFGLKMTGDNGAYYKLFNNLVPDLSGKSSFTFHDLVPDQIYYYRRRTKVNGRWGEWSSIRSFSISEVPFPEEDNGLTSDITIVDQGESGKKPGMDLHTSQPVTKTSWSSAEAAEVYPNPNRGNFRVRFGQPATTNHRLYVIDATGRLLFSLKAAEGAQEQAIDLTDYPSGIYWVQWIEPGKAPVSLKLVLQKD